MWKDIKEIFTNPIYSNKFGEFSLDLFFYSLMIILGAFIFSRILNRMLKKKYYEKNKLDIGVQAAYNRILHYTIMIVAFIVALSTMGFNLSVLMASSAALLVGIGFGIQNIANNFISGIVLLFERPIKVGDFIEVDGFLGTVREIKGRCTKIETNDNITIIVPNSTILEHNVINWSYTSNTRIEIPIGVAYGSDLQHVKNVLIEVAKGHQAINTIPEPTVFCDKYGDSSIDLSLLVWIKNQAQFKLIKSDLNFAIDLAFKKNNIEIPFPQRDLHLKSSELKNFL